MTDLPPTLKASVESQKAEYKQLGRSGLRVSVPILGAMGFGDQAWLNWVINEDEVIICFDLYNSYAKPEPRHCQSSKQPTIEA